MTVSVTHQSQSVQDAVAVVPATTPALVDAFVELPYTLYAADPHWVPPLRRDEYRRLDRRHNAFLAHADIDLWVALDGSRPCGRIAAIQDHAHDAFHHERVAWFGFFESPDAATAGRLLATVEAWGRARGCTSVRGPVNPSLNESAGLLVRGFDDDPCVLMPYNPPSYAGWIEDRGYAKPPFDPVALIRRQPSADGAATLATPSEVQRSAFANPVLIGATILGGKGNDTVRGGSGNDLIYGGEGNDNLAGAGGSLPSFLRRPYGTQALDEAVDEVALHEHGVGAGLAHRPVELGRRVAGERDEAEVRMILAQARDGGDAVHHRHVQVDDDRVRIELVGELDRVEAVVRGPGHGQHGLVLDQGPERLQEVAVVVHEQDANRYRDRPFRLVHGRTLALPA